MKNSAFSLLLALPLISSASAALLAYDGFSSANYNAGANPTSADYATDNLAGQGSGSGSGFTSGWVQNPTLTSSGDLYWLDNGGTSSAASYIRANGAQSSYSTLPTTPGQAVFQTSAANRISLQRNFTTGTSAPATLFVSTLISIDGSAGISLGFQSGNGTDNRPFQFGFNQNGTLFAMGTGPSSANPSATSSTVYGPGTYFVVAQFSDGSTNNDSITLWVNPPSLTTLGTPSLVLNNSTNTPAQNPNFYVAGNSGYAVTGLVLDLRSDGTTSGSTIIDEIRIGNTYADVVPEPGASLLAALSSALLLVRRQRKA